MRPFLISTAALLCLAPALAGCVTAPTSLAAAPPAVEARRDSSPYGLFLAGQVAMNGGDSRRAAAYFAEAARAEPGERAIRERAFTSALMSGDIAAAVRAAPTERPAALSPLTTSAGPPQSSAELATARAAQDAARSATADGLARLTRAVDDLAAARGDQAAALLAGEFGAHEQAAALMRPWAAAAAGDWEAALAEPPATSAGATAVQALTRALLLERRGRRAEADAAFASLGDPAGFTLTVTARGEYLERAGRRAEAAALYDAALANNPDDVGMRRARERAASGGRPPALPTLQQGAARALLLPTVALIAADQREIGLLYLRLVLRLDAEMHDGWLLAGDTLTRLQDHEGARLAYARVPTTSPLWAQAQGRIVQSWTAEERGEEALRLARAALATAPDDQELKLSLAGVLIDQDAYPEAIVALDGLDWRANWRVAYLRGVALERADRWPEAEASLQAALALRPNEPELLNYLGYAWIDRGVRLEEGAAMLDRAMQASPESGAIVDSVGWARYRLGRYEDAVGLLERAVQLEPGDPTVNDHLGDAYWRVGRRVEARFQWRRALTLDPEPEVRAAAEAKLASDLGPDAAQATQAARQP